MKTSIKTIACAAAAAILLVSCNDTSISNANNGDDSNNDAVTTKQFYDPPMLVIADDVGKWMAEQTASKSSEKRLIMISDMYLPDIESAAGLSATRDSDGKVEYFLNGEKISVEEYSRRWEYASRTTNTGKRDLSIPGEMISSEGRSWTVLITAEELNGLSKKYDKLAISFYIEPEND
jgi:hypothetical protein